MFDMLSVSRGTCGARYADLRLDGREDEIPDPEYPQQEWDTCAWNACTTSCFVHCFDSSLERCRVSWQCHAVCVRERARAGRE